MRKAKDDQKIFDAGCRAKKVPKKLSQNVNFNKMKLGK